MSTPPPTMGQNGTPHAGAAGASARREHERRKAARERRVRERHPRLGGALLALSDAPQHETAWARGAAGEEQVAAVLAERVNENVVLLHDRRIPGSRANIDHLAVAPSGVWVIDTKRYKGQVKVTRPLLGRPRLLVAGRDRSTLVDGLARQVERVREAVDRADSTAPVHSALCFVDADLPLIGTTRFRGIPLLYAKALAKRLNQAGDLTGPQVRTLAALLTKSFPPA